MVFVAEATIAILSVKRKHLQSIPARQIRLNVSKCVQMRVACNKELLVHTYNINNCSLASIDQFIYLELHVSSFLS